MLRRREGGFRETTMWHARRTLQTLVKGVLLEEVRHGDTLEATGAELLVPLLLQPRELVDRASCSSDLVVCVLDTEKLLDYMGADEALLMARRVNSGLHGIAELALDSRWLR